MPSRAARLAALVLIAAHATGGAVAEEPRGTFGFVAKVDADGIFKPTLKSVFVQSVTQGMPAATAGVVAGDSILEVEGVQVAGAGAYAMAERLKKRPGETLVLKLLRANGETYSVTLIAAQGRN